MKTKITIYEIYDVEESYPFEKCSLSIGTLKEVVDDFKSWLDEHLQNNDFEDEEEFFNDYSEVKLFIDNPKEWVNVNGDSDSEIYMGWKLNFIYQQK